MFFLSVMFYSIFFADLEALVEQNQSLALEYMQSVSHNLGLDNGTTVEERILVRGSKM